MNDRNDRYYHCTYVLNINYIEIWREMRDRYILKIGNASDPSQRGGMQISNKQTCVVKNGDTITRYFKKDIN